MIEINLLPEELKVKVKEKPKPVKPVVQSTMALNVIKLLPLVAAGTLAILLCFHLFFLLKGVISKSQLYALNRQWQRLQPQRSSLESFNKEYALISEDASSLQRLFQQRVNWAPKLNRLSLDLSPGAWFSEVDYSPPNFSIRGSVFSLTKEEMGLLKTLIESLKNDSLFFGDFVSLELGPVNRRMIGSYDIIDFILQGSIQKK